MEAAELEEWEQLNWRRGSDRADGAESAEPGAFFLTSLDFGFFPVFARFGLFPVFAGFGFSPVFVRSDFPRASLDLGFSQSSLDAVIPSSKGQEGATTILITKSRPQRRRALTSPRAALSG